jgi:hypothetical protein
VNKYDFEFYYSHGYDFEIIMEEMNISQEEFHSILQDFDKKRLSKEHRQEIDKIIGSRYDSGVNQKKICEELSCGIYSINRIIKNYAKTPLPSRFKTKDFFTEIKVEDEKYCPNCNSGKIRNVTNPTHDFKDAPKEKEFLCLDCLFSWLKKGDEFLKINHHLLEND